jgi:hypothetical protein
MYKIPLFKTNFPNHILFDFLDKICVKTEKFYYIDVNAYNKMRYHQYHVDFYKTMREYYFENKAFYLERPVDYRSFVNIVRQICKNNLIQFSSKMNFNESKYNIDYYIYF